MARTDTFNYTPAIKFKQVNLDLILARVKYRIFNQGKNSAGQQTKRPKDKTAGLWLYRTGKLFRSARVYNFRPGVVTISFTRAEVIINYLEKRNGIMFDFTAEEKKFINQLAERQDRQDKARRAA